MKFVRPCLVAMLLFALACATAPEPAPAPPPPPPAPVAPPPPPPPDPRDFTAQVRFEAGSASLSDAGQRELRSFAAKLQPYPERRVHVVGYRAPSESQSERPRLSEQRAKNVAAFLVFQGIAADHVSLQGLDAEAAAAGGRLVTVTVR